MLTDLFKLSLNNLRRRKLRSWLTLLGIFIGIAAVVALISLGQGLQTAITGQFSTLSTDKLTIQNSGTGFGPPGSTVVKKLNDHDIKVIEGVRGVELTVTRIIRVVRTEYNSAVSFSYMADIPEDRTKMNMVYDAAQVKVDKGRLLEPGDFGKIIIGSDVADEKTFNKQIDIGKKIKINGKDFEVIGILKRGSTFQINDVILMLNKDMEDLLNLNNKVDIIIAQVANGEKPEEVKVRIENALRKDRSEKIGEEDFSVQTPLEAISAVNNILSAVNIVVIGIAMISLIVGGIGIANTMYTSVLERNKEIGTMKAIGAKNSDILYIFVIESGLLGLVGGIIGVIIGSGAALGVSLIANSFFESEIITVNLSIPLIIFAVGFSFLIGIVSGVVPSYQASKLKPVDALRG
jgi:putative ABC transport system permease protein